MCLVRESEKPRAGVAAAGDHDGWSIDNPSLLETTMRKISYATAFVAVAANLVIVRPVSLVFVTRSYCLLARAESQQPARTGQQSDRHTGEE